jgi:hypothetical protein
MLYPSILKKMTLSDKTCLLGSNIYEILNAALRFKLDFRFCCFFQKRIDIIFPMHFCSDLSYNNFTWQGPEQPACQKDMSDYLYNNFLHIFFGRYGLKLIFLSPYIVLLGI